METEFACNDCGKKIEEGEGHYNYPLVRCQACGDKVVQGNFKHYGDIL